METFDTSVAPPLIAKETWTGLSEEAKIKHTYWACTVALPRKFLGLTIKRCEVKGTWVAVHHSKENAEAHACTLGPMDWDGQPAEPITLPDAMRQARRRKRLGIAIMGYLNGWTVIKRYHAGVPLPENPMEG